MSLCNRNYNLHHNVWRVQQLYFGYRWKTLNAKAMIRRLGKDQHFTTYCFANILKGAVKKYWSCNHSRQVQFSSECLLLT